MSHWRSGALIYIATSDDTMQPNALEKMQQALDRHPDCGLCDSILTIIGSSGKQSGSDSYIERGLTYHLDFIDEINEGDNEVVRQGWEDVLRHCSGKTVYTSIAQLLIRTTLFKKTGYFPVDCGSSGDFLWGFRAAIHTNIIFLPLRLTTWRLHENQVTGHTTSSSQSAVQMFKMMETGIAEISQSIVKQAALKLKILPEIKYILARHKGENGFIPLLLDIMRVSIIYPLFFWSLVTYIPCELFSRSGTLDTRCYGRLFKKRFRDIKNDVLYSLDSARKSHDSK